MDIKDVKTAELVKKYNFKFSKSLGQNFLVDDSVTRDIVSGADVNKEDLAIEIGPGVGTLTAQLLKTAKRVVAIELDNDLIPILEQELGGNPNFTLIHNDALKVDFNEIIGDEKSVKLVANLPYYVTTPIIFKLLTVLSASSKGIPFSCKIWSLSLAFFIISKAEYPSIVFIMKFTKLSIFSLTRFSSLSVKIPCSSLYMPFKKALTRYTIIKLCSLSNNRFSCSVFKISIFLLFKNIYSSSNIDFISATSIIKFNVCSLILLNVFNDIGYPNSFK